MQRAISLRCKILHQYCHQSLQIQWWWLGKMRPVVKTWRFESNLICSKSAFVLWSTRELEQSSNSNFHISTAWSDYKSVRSLPSNRRNTLKLNVLYIKMWPKKLGSKLTEKWRKRQYLDHQVYCWFKKGFRILTWRKSGCRPDSRAWRCCRPAATTFQV